VSNLAAEVDELRSRGVDVDVEEYDAPRLKTVDGIADVGFAPAAWFVDPRWQLDRAAAVQGRGGHLTGHMARPDRPETTPEPAGGPITTTVTRRVKPGHEPVLRAVGHRHHRGGE
jgi:hypothetical protein